MELLLFSLCRPLVSQYTTSAASGPRRTGTAKPPTCCWLLDSSHIKHYCRMFMKISPEMQLWRRNYSLEVIWVWIRIWEFLKEFYRRALCAARYSRRQVSVGLSATLDRVLYPISAKYLVVSCKRHPPISELNRVNIRLLMYV